MSFSPGEVIDNKYRVVRLIGEGGMGAVYEGENTRISRRVAIKVLRAEAAGRPELAARFQREARAAARIGSKHICDVLDLGDLPNGDAYLVMEFLDGQDLDGRIKDRGCLTDSETAIIAYQLLEGLATMHEAGIIHRDLKPANVFLCRGSRGETVKILDFGVSKFTKEMQEAGQMTQTGAVMGTPLYMSPEQARGARDLDGRSDVYSAGVVLYKTLTGKLPFRGDNFNEILFKIALEVPPSVNELAPDVAPELAAIIDKAMQKDPNDRFQSARELQQAIYEFGINAGITLEAAVSIPPSAAMTPQNGVLAPPGSLKAPGLPQMQQIVADGFSTATAWAARERQVAESSLIASADSDTELAPLPVPESTPLLLAALDAENEKSRTRTRVVFGGIIALIAAGAVAGIVMLKQHAAAADQPQGADSIASAAHPTPPPPTTEVAAITSATTTAPSATSAGRSNPAMNAAMLNPGANPVPVPVMSIGALPMAPTSTSNSNATSNATSTPNSNSNATSTSTPNASASAKRDWGVIAPTVPTVEKKLDPPAN